MATIIKLKRSTTASAVPTTSNLADGEVAVNITDKKIYQRNGNDIIEIANNSNFSSVSSNLLPDTDNAYSIGSSTNSFTDLFLSGKPKKQVDIFTNSGGLSTAAAGFVFRINTEAKNFTEVYTNSGGLGSPAITSSSNYDDNNPAYLF